MTTRVRGVATNASCILDEAVAGFSGRGLAVLAEAFVSWFPNNLARNSLARLSNIEIQSLVLQRLWKLLNRQENELRAKFLGGAGVRLGRGERGERGECGECGERGECGA